MATNLTSKGQVTVPKKVRDYLGLKPGAPVTFERLATGEIALRAAKSARPPEPHATSRTREFAVTSSRPRNRRNSSAVIQLNWPMSSP